MYMMAEARRLEHLREWIYVQRELRHRPSALPEMRKLLDQYSEGIWDMARKVKEANKKELKKAEFKGFANVELTIEEKAEMREWIKNTEAVQVELDEMLASLYKISITKSEATGSYMASAFAQDARDVNAGLIISAHAPHWWDAMACLAYKHAIHCEGVWDTTGDGEADLWG